MSFVQVVTHLAIAIQFLLLPPCRSLNVMENRHVLKDTLIFGVHHKAGTVLAQRASKCFNSSFNHNIDVHWEGGQLRPDERALHFTRDPISLALSAYIYHKETGEDWSLNPGGEMRRLAKDPYLRQFMINASEPYTDYLRRVDTRVGIRAEINRLTHAYAELHEMERADKFCATSSRCMQMCFEDFTVSSSSYDASWRKVLNFMGTFLTPQMHTCLQKYDLNRHPVSSGHVTSNRLTATRYDQLRNMVAGVDARAFGGRLKKMGEGRLYCGGYTSKFFHTRTGINATDGGDYSEWLIEEAYSNM